MSARIRSKPTTACRVASDKRDCLIANLEECLAIANTAIETNIPLSDLDAWLTLAFRVKGAGVRSLPVTNSVINTVHPDFRRVHLLVQAALRPPAPSEARPSPAPSGQPSATRSTPPRVTASATPTVRSDRPVDVEQVC